MGLEMKTHWPNKMLTTTYEKCKRWRFMILEFCFNWVCENGVPGRGREAKVRVPVRCRCKHRTTVPGPQTYQAVPLRHHFSLFALPRSISLLPRIRTLQIAPILARALSPHRPLRSPLPHRRRRPRRPRRDRQLPWSGARNRRRR